MEPISVALLAAFASGAGGEAGRQAWAELRALVRRPFRGRVDASAGTAELDAVAQDPSDPALVEALAAVLAARATADAEFRRALADWQELARAAVPAGFGDVHSSITGGTFHGPVVTGRDFSGGITFGHRPEASREPDD